MIRPLGICVLLSIANWCIGDEPVPEYANHPSRNAAETRTEPSLDEQQPPKLDEATRKYLSEHVHKLIDKYEARIAQLEDEIARRPVPQPAPNYTPYRTSAPQYAFPQWNPAPVQPPSPYAPPQPNPAPVQPPSPYAQPGPSTVPDSWQRFNFNGQWFYIIPVEQAAALAPLLPR